MSKSKIENSQTTLQQHNVIRRAGGEYFPNKPIWLVFDHSNGHKPSRRYVWWFDTKKQANEWIKEHFKNKHAYDVSIPVRWKPCAKHLLAPVPCNNHKPKQLGYVAWHEWADKMYKQGREQTQCDKCGRWYFKSEM